MIKRVATACKCDGVPHWLEPIGGMSGEDEVSRVMEALSCGNWGYWDWADNPLAARAVYRQCSKRFLTRAATRRRR